MAITILLRTYYNLRLLFLYVNRNTYIRKSMKWTSLKNIEYMKTMNYSLIRICLRLS